MRSGPPLKPSDALVVDLLRESNSGASASKRPIAKQEPKPRPVPPRPPVLLPKPATPPNRPLDLLVLSRDEMAAADIGKLGTAAGAGTAVAGNDDSSVVGRGPRGETLYAAEWAREPTDTELGGYLPPNAPNGYGLVACRTAPQNRVEDCVELENSPRGSRLASAVRQAAWQFRVKPPRKNGRALVGEWVRIRIDYSSMRIQ